MNATLGEVVRLEQVHCGRESLDLAEAPLPLGQIERSVRLEKWLELVQPPLVGQLVRRRARRLEKCIHQRPQPAQEHLPCDRGVVDRVE